MRNFRRVISNASSSFISGVCSFVQSGLVFEQVCPSLEAEYSASLCLITKLSYEFPLWLSSKEATRIHEAAGLILGLTQ